MTKAEVHRPLVLASPLVTGEDVEQLQHACNRIFEDKALEPWFIAADAELGRQTARAAFRAEWIIGLGPKTLHLTKHEHVLGQRAQRLVRNPDERDKGAIARSKNRQPKVARIRRRLTEGPDACMRWALQQVGTTENPSGSNSGPDIDVWHAFWGLGPNPWCGIFAGYGVVKIGGAQAGCWFPYAPSITSDALAGNNGLHAVPFDRARKADVATFWGGQHIGLVQRVEGDSLYTVEGNTSFGDGSQSDGGAVAERVRSRSDVDVIARPNWAG